MLFVVVIPTAEYEQQVIYGVLPEERSSADFEQPVERHIGNRPAARVPPTPTKGGSRGRNPVVLRSGKTIPQDVPMETLLEEIFVRLYISNVVWCLDKEKNFYQIMFLRDLGDETENCLHALQQIGIGQKLNSMISVSPSSVYEVADEKDLPSQEEEGDLKAWSEFVDSVRSKLTVAEVVDGVKASAELTFDYVLLILTADMIAAVSLVENDSVNVVAAMLISPLMSCVVAITFGAAISDRDLMKTGWRSAMVGMCISWVFGFIFGLLVGCTESPWGSKGWPTYEMKTRGDPRSLWIGALWAMPSGSGVALALLQGSAGPLIGVAISATLLPPVVNCGMLWALACMKVHYGDKMKMPDLTAGTDPSHELVVLGAISFCLFLVNFGCIFAAAMVVLKIKEIAAPYTSSVDLRRFWETDVKVARKYNRESHANRKTRRESRKSRDYIPEAARKSNIPEESLGEALEAAMKEAMDDATYRKIKRCSYAPRSEDVIGQVMGKAAANRRSSKQNTNDPEVMDQLVQALLEQIKSQQNKAASAGGAQDAATPQQGLNRLRPLSRSMRAPSFKGRERRRSSAFNQGINLPTIMEGGNLPKRTNRPMSLSERAMNVPGVRNVLQGLGNLQQRTAGDEEAPAPGNRARRGSESIALMRSQP